MQAAINAGGSLLPADLPAPPVYAKVNPADAPVLTLAISSDTLPLTEVQNLVNTRLAQKISQVGGVGLVSLSGGQRPAVRIQANTACAGFGRHRPGHAAHRDRGRQRQQRQGQLRRAEARLHHQRQRPAGDRGRLPEPDRGLEERRAGPHERRGARDRSAENNQLGAWAALHGDKDTDGELRPAIILSVQRQPGANVIGTVDAIKKQLPELQASLPGSLRVEVLSRPHHRHPRLGKHVQMELVLAVVLVVLVIFFFLHSLRATLIVSIAVPISLVGTFGLAASSALSVSNWRTRRPRPAPSAARMASSRSRASPRATPRFARLAHAIKSTSPTAPSSICSERRSVFPTIVLA